MSATDGAGTAGAGAGDEGAGDDRAAICDLLARYGRGLDSRDFEAVRECFTPDATATFSGVDLPPGRDAIVQHVRGLASMPASTHLFGLPVVEIDGDVARADVAAVAYLHTADGRLLTRGLRYVDDLVRTEHGWRIRRRLHRVEWMTEAAAVPPSTPRP